MRIVLCEHHRTLRENKHPTAFSYHTWFHSGVTMGTSECFLHTWEYLHDRSHRICKTCGLCQIKSVNDWMQCSFPFLQDHIKRTEGENEKHKQQQEKDEKDRKRALQYLDSLKPKKCLKCQTMNIAAAEFCKSCGAPIMP